LLKRIHIFDHEKCNKKAGLTLLDPISLSFDFLHPNEAHPIQRDE